MRKLAAPVKSLAHYAKGTLKKLKYVRFHYRAPLIVRRFLSFTLLFAVA